MRIAKEIAKMCYNFQMWDDDDDDNNNNNNNNNNNILYLASGDDGRTV
jgi:hypothetical protein